MDAATKITTEERTYVDGESTVLLRIKYPSEPSGGWPGNKVQCRVWEICVKGETLFRRCTDEQVVKFESKVGLPIGVLKFIEHPTLGRVATF